MGDLRPVGTEFEIESPPSMASTDPRPLCIRYRIVAHVLGLDEYRREVAAEKIEAIKVTYLKPPDVISFSQLAGT